MDSNKDEATRCIEIGVTALTEGKISRAEKFLRKAEQLYPSQRAKDLLEKLKSTPNADNSDAHNNDGIHKRTNMGGANKENKFTEPDYTPEQLEAVKRIKRCKDYYEVLGVTKESADSDIKKAYKKQALVLHPDKNKAPGSVEAFKAIGNAVAILTDPEKRKAYDLHGSNEPFNPHGGGQSGGVGRRHFNNEYAYTRGFESDVTAEELFNMFFGGAFQQPNIYNRQRQFRQREYHREREVSPNMKQGCTIHNNFFSSNNLTTLDS
ncbi:DNAJB12 family protein [Megaselia abdita]